MGFIINPFLTVAAPSITPASFPGLKRNYRSDSYSLPDGTSLSTSWTDLSGNSNAAVGSAPTFKTNIFGTKPGIRFFPAQYMESALLTLTDFTIMVVTANVGDWIFISTPGAGNFQARIGQSASEGLTFYSNGGLVTSSTPSVLKTSKRINIYRRTGSTVNLRVNKEDLGSGSSGNAFDTGRVGLGDGGPDSGDMGEVCIWDNALSDANCDSLYDNYFKTLWSLP